MKLKFSQIIDPQKGFGFELDTGEILKIIDPQGQQVADFFCFAKADPREHFSAGRTLDYNDSIFISTGATLYSNRSSEFLKIIEDSCGRHDLLMTPCSLKMFQLVSNTDQYHPSCYENLAQAFAPFDIAPDQIDTTFNVFMKVAVQSNGAIQIEAPESKPGDSLSLLALNELIVGVTACSYEETNNGLCKPIHLEIWSPD